MDFYVLAFNKRFIKGTVCVCVQHIWVMAIHFFTFLIFIVLLFVAVVRIALFISQFCCFGALRTVTFCLRDNKNERKTKEIGNACYVTH